MALTDPNLRIVQGDATDQASMARALEGADAVISTLDTPGPVIADATRAILRSTQGEDAPRVVMMSSFAVQRDRIKGLAKLVSGAAAGPKMRDKAAVEKALRASSLRWTIVYATLLTNGPRQPQPGTTTGVLRSLQGPDLRFYPAAHRMRPDPQFPGTA